MKIAPPPGKFYLSKFYYFFITITLSLLFYIFLLNLILYFHPNAIIFFFSCILSFVLALGVFFFSLYKMHYDLFCSTLLSLNLFFILMFFAIFGPVFIDRSISYHIAFIAAEEKQINTENLSQKWGEMMIEKRLEDGVSAGILKKEENGYFSSTAKAKKFTTIMLLLGRATGSLNTYEQMKEKYDEIRH